MYCQSWKLKDSQILLLLFFAPMNFFKFLSPFLFNVVGGMTPILLSLFWGVSPSFSAENIVLKAGFLNHKIPVKDLKTFVETKEISPSLQPYKFLLTSEFRQVLSQKFQIDPLIAERFLNDLLKSDDGQRLLKLLSQALPDSDYTQLEQALRTLLKQTNNFNFINFLRVYPQETVTFDISKAAILGLKINESFFHSRLINSQVKKGLKDDSQIDNLPTFDPTVSGKQSISQENTVLYYRSRNRYIYLDIYTAKKARGHIVI
ncbi:MAG: alpha/beta hydrolase, partial [Xenococcus sp. (in: cyanobacteria)]